MEDRRKGLRRQADKAILQRLRELEACHDRRVRSEDGEHMRRRAIRHNCAVLIRPNYEYGSDRLDAWAGDSLGVKGRVLDLSTGGASVFSHDRFELGQELQLSFALHEETEVDVVAMVRWVKAIPDKNGFASGVQFRDLPERDKAKISRFLEQLDATVGL